MNAERVEVKLADVEALLVDMTQLLVEVGLSASKSDSRRLIKQGSVSVNVCPAEIGIGYPWEKVTHHKWVIDPQETMIKVGRRFRLVSVSQDQAGRIQ